MCIYSNYIGTLVHTCMYMAQCISNLHTKCANRTCLDLSLNNDFNEQVLGRGTQGIEAPCLSWLQAALGWVMREGYTCIIHPPHSVSMLSMYHPLFDYTEPFGITIRCRTHVGSFNCDYTMLKFIQKLKRELCHHSESSDSSIKFLKWLFVYSCMFIN